MAQAAEENTSSIDLISLLLWARTVFSTSEEICQNFILFARKRFTASHELGHLLLEEKIVSDLNHERVANRFAGAFLLPKETIIKEIDKHRNRITISELEHIKQKYGISIQAIMYRLKDLGIISESKHKSFSIANNRHKFDEDCSLKGKEELSRFDNLLARAYSEGLITSSKLAELSGYGINEALDRLGEIF